MEFSTTSMALRLLQKQLHLDSCFIVGSIFGGLQTQQNARQNSTSVQRRNGICGLPFVLGINDGSSRTRLHRKINRDVLKSNELMLHELQSLLGVLVFCCTILGMRTYYRSFILLIQAFNKTSRRTLTFAAGLATRHAQMALCISLMDTIFTLGCVAHNANFKLTHTLASWDSDGLGPNARKCVHGPKSGYLALDKCQNRLRLLRSADNESWMAVKAKKTVAYGWLFAKQNIALSRAWLYSCFP
jgi:hypothetical protein